MHWAGNACLLCANKRTSRSQVSELTSLLSILFLFLFILGPLRLGNRALLKTLAC